MIDQIFVILLALMAWDIAVGLYQKRNMWSHIVAYWCVLTAKNFASWIGGLV